jgi:hypothetical protein
MYTQHSFQRRMTRLNSIAFVVAFFQCCLVIFSPSTTTTETYAFTFRSSSRGDVHMKISPFGSLMSLRSTKDDSESASNRRRRPKKSVTDRSTKEVIDLVQVRGSREFNHTSFLLLHHLIIYILTFT